MVKLKVTRELISDALFVGGGAALVAAGFVLHLAIGLVVLAVVLVVLGMAMTPGAPGGQS